MAINSFGAGYYLGLANGRQGSSATVSLPTLAFASAVSQAEGQSGTTNFTFTLNLTRNGSTAAIPFTWTVAGSGTNPANATDFVGGVFPNGSGTFAAGETSKTITVPVAPDSTVEPDEGFTVSASASIPLASAVAAGTILNDDFGPSAKPNAPTITATSGNGQSALAITDDAASQQVRKWGIYQADAAGGTPVFQGWAYTREQLHRRFLTNGSSKFYRVSAWNTLGESPLSAEVTASAAATNFNPLRMAKVRFFANTLFYAQIIPDFRPAVNAYGSVSGSVLTVTSGAVTIGATVALGNAWTSTTITSQLSGTTNGAGTYQLSAAPTQGNQGNGTTFYLFPTAITVSASDGTALSTKPQNGSILVYGTFTAAGSKTITYTEAVSGGATNTSTQPVNVMARPAVATYSALKTTAQAIKARMNAKPVYTSSATITATDNGATMPSGYTATKTVYAGKSIYPANQYAAIASFAPQQYGVNGYDPVEQGPTGAQTTIPQSSAANNGVIRVDVSKRTWVIGVSGGGAGANVMTHFRARFSDDNMATWTEQARPYQVQFGSGTHFITLDGGSIPASRRIWEVEFSPYSFLANSIYVSGFGFETGDTPAAVTDNSPIVVVSNDSFANGVGAADQTRNSARTMARRLGLLNLWNMAKPSYRYSLPVATQALGVDAIGGNAFGIGDLDMPPRVDLWAPDWTINDNGQSDDVQLQAMLTNMLLEARYTKPNMLIVFSVGFWAPNDRAGYSTGHANAVAAAIADASGNGADKGMKLNDGVAAGWAVAGGATGSSPQFFSSNSQQITGSTSGTTLTVTSGSGIELGMYVFSGPVSGNNWVRVRVIEQLSGTTGGAGTYLLDGIPSSGDFSSGSTIYLNSEDFGGNTYPVHPSPAGQVWIGNRKADGAEALVNDIIANAA